MRDDSSKVGWQMCHMLTLTVCYCLLWLFVVSSSIVIVYHKWMSCSIFNGTDFSRNSCQIYEIVRTGSAHPDFSSTTPIRPHAVKHRVTWCERKHSHCRIRGTINEVMTLYIYLQVIRIQGPRSRILSLPKLSEERSFCLVYITKRKIKSWRRSPQA